MKSFQLPAIQRPIAITPVSIPGMAGIIGISACPGMKDEACSLDLYEESLLNDLLTIRNWGAVAVVTVLDTLEIRTLRVIELPNAAVWLDLRWFHLPIDSSGVPGQDFEELWRTVGPQLCKLLREGKRIVLHCKEGIDRSGLVAARLLIELGMTPEKAIAAVQAAKPECLQHYAHKNYCYALSGDR